MATTWRHELGAELLPGNEIQDVYTIYEREINNDHDSTATVMVGGELCVYNRKCVSCMQIDDHKTTLCTG